jgi:hypothetical protein
MNWSLKYHYNLLLCQRTKLVSFQLVCDRRFDIIDCSFFIQLLPFSSWLAWNWICLHLSRHHLYNCANLFAVYSTLTRFGVLRFSVLQMRTNVFNILVTKSFCSMPQTNVTAMIMICMWSTTPPPRFHVFISQQSQGMYLMGIGGGRVCWLVYFYYISFKSINKLMYINKKNLNRRVNLHKILRYSLRSVSCS